jgi:heme oxygenase (mycobilin-producing)
MANVVLINPFEVPLESGDEFLRGWSEAADYMSRRPGFRGTRLHRALAPEARFGFINIAEWESPHHFQAAVTTPKFAEMTKGGPPSNPALYEVVRTIEAGSP